MFDWLDFLQSRRIEYNTNSASATKGNVAVRCPFCGSDDPGTHMAISITGKGWRCWRNIKHSGKNPVPLVAALIRCTLDQAREIVGQPKGVDANFLDNVKNLLAEDSAPEEQKRPIRLPNDFRPIAMVEDLPSGKPYAAYLRKRGYAEPRRLWRWELYYCTRGFYSGRVMFPVRHKGELVGWTGRHIGRHTIRYLSSSLEGRPAISNFLLWRDNLVRYSKRGFNTIILCEGPFDALRINWLGRPHGICATCFFTASPSPSQVNLLHNLLPRFERKLLMLDQGTLPTALRLTWELSSLDVHARYLPLGVKDPGEIKETQLLKLVLDDRDLAG